jgi:hypothetical protein
MPLGTADHRGEQATRRQHRRTGVLDRRAVAIRVDLAAATVCFAAGNPQLPDPRRVIPGDEIMVVFPARRRATWASILLSFTDAR